MARPRRMGVLVAEYLEALEAKGYSAMTLTSYRSTLGMFVRWADSRRISSPGRVTGEVLDAYRAEMLAERLANKTRRRTDSVLRGFFAHLVRCEVVDANPVPPGLRQRRSPALPKQVMTANEIDRLLDRIDVRTVCGLRDRAMIELLYTSGIRRFELVRLRIEDVDRSGGLLRVREGKGGKDRIVPVGRRALHWIQRYLADGRPRQMKKRCARADPGTLFVSKYAVPMNPSSVTTRCKVRALAVGIRKPSGAHAFRHAAATLMLENGADVRYVQAFLGHASIDTTVIYTHVAVRTLCDVHRKCHPRW